VPKAVEDPIALAEDQVDDREYGRQSLGDQVRGGDVERQAGGLELLLGARQPPLHRLRRDEERLRDLVCGQAAEGAKRAGDFAPRPGLRRDLARTDAGR
jgi:hypothetical protein